MLAYTLTDCALYMIGKAEKKVVSAMEQQVIILITSFLP